MLSCIQILGPVVVSILKEAMAGCPSSVSEMTPELLLKDAAYGAAAYVYYELSALLSFSEWYISSLLHVHTGLLICAICSYPKVCFVALYLRMFL